MIVLCLKTDQPLAELALYDGQELLSKHDWQAHRELGATLFKSIDQLLKSSSKQLQDIDGIVAYQGPGSFTGLRIGLTAANTLAYALGIPIVAAQGDDWRIAGINLINQKTDQKVALPFYGSEAIITKQKR